MKPKSHITNTEAMEQSTVTLSIKRSESKVNFLRRATHIFVQALGNEIDSSYLFS